MHNTSAALCNGTRVKYLRRVGEHNSHCTLHTPPLFTHHPSPFTLHTSHFTLRRGLHTSHFALHTSHFTLPPSQFTLHIALFTLHTTHCNTAHCNTSHYPHHTSHFTLHTSHFTLHTAHFPIHPLSFILHTSHRAVNDPVWAAFVADIGKGQPAVFPATCVVTDVNALIEAVWPGGTLMCEDNRGILTMTREYEATINKRVMAAFVGDVDIALSLDTASVIVCVVFSFRVLRMHWVCGVLLCVD